MRAVDGLMAASRPAGAPGQSSGMILAADQNLSGRGLLLEVALQTETGVSLREHPLID